MKTAVVYYTFGGSTRKEAERIAAEQGADLFRVREAGKRSLLGAFVPGVIEAMKRRKPRIQPEALDLSAYERIYLGCPVWAAHPAPAFNAMVELLPAGKEVAVFFCGAGNDPRESDAQTRRLIEARGCMLTRMDTIPTGLPPHKGKEA